MFGHEKRLARTVHVPSGTFDADGSELLDKFEVLDDDGHGSLPEALFYVKGTPRESRAFITFATRLRAVFCDKTSDGIPRACAETVDYPDGCSRPHVNKVYRVTALPTTLLELAEHSAVLKVESVFVCDGRPPRAGTGQASGDVSAQVKRAMKGRDARARELYARSKPDRAEVHGRDRETFQGTSPSDRTVQPGGLPGERTIDLRPAAFKPAKL
jgi:hypothetical protein